MQKSDTLYMWRCIELAQLSYGFNRPNPEVGSLIVHNNIIIGEGWHKKYGSAHAEVNAIESVKNKEILAESTLFVTLEPCFHFGKTPPCVDLILKHKIPKVVIGCRDPYHEVAGRSIEKLKNHGVEVVSDVLEKEISWLNRRFFTNVEKKRPYITLKFAASRDGFIGVRGQNVQISGPTSKRFVHKLRADEAGIMVGTETAICDNPQLNIRHFFGQQPTRVVLDKNLRLPKNLHLFDKSQKTIVFTEKVCLSTTEMCEYVAIDFSSRNFLQDLMHELLKRKIYSILIEGGATLLNSFIAQNLWDEAYIIRSQTLQLHNGILAPVLNPSLCCKTVQMDSDSIEHYTNT